MIPYLMSPETGTDSVAVADLNSDNYLDIVVFNALEQRVFILLGYGNGTFGNETIFQTVFSNDFNVFAVGDFNEDDHLDIAVVSNRHACVYVFLGYGNATLGSPTCFSTGKLSYPRSMAVADFNGDNHLDIAATDTVHADVCVLLGYGNGNFRAVMTFPTGEQSKPVSLAVGDFNGDKHLDIAVANYATHNIGVLLGYGNGTFGTQTTFSPGIDTYSSSIAVGYFNDDSHLDIVLVNFNHQNIDVFLGYGNGLFEKQIPVEIRPLNDWATIAVSDFNSDNRTDCVIGNHADANAGILLSTGECYIAEFFRKRMRNVRTIVFLACILGKP